MREIELTKGYKAIVDDEDYIFLSRFSWQAIPDSSGNVYASTNFKLDSGNWVRIPMSRFLYTPKIQRKVAYKNKNTLDNRKENILLLTTAEFNGTAWKMYQKKQQHKRSKPKLKNPSSQYKGVSKIKDPRYKIKSWKATIQKNGRPETKCFEHEWEAAEWYNEKALEYFGEHAYQNKIV
jgi:hypothetical protein